MIDLTNIDGIYLYSEFVDFRYGILSLTGMVLSKFKNMDNINNSLFIFCNRKRNQLKILQIDKLGMWLYTRRLNNAKFIYPEDQEGIYKITKDNLKVIISGLEFISKIEKKDATYISVFDITSLFPL